MGSATLFNSQMGRRAAHVTTCVAVIFAMYAGGFLAGNKLYSTIGQSHRVGFQTWSRIYRPILFFRARNTGGFKYSDINRVTKIDGTIDSGTGDGKGNWSLHFVRSDGTGEFAIPWHEPNVQFPTVSTNEPLEVFVTLTNNREQIPSWMPNPKQSTIKLVWWIEVELIDIDEQAP